MRYEVYSNLQATDDFSIVDFISEGKNGQIPKRIVFTATGRTGVYNLAFGDIDENGEIDDYCIINNGGRNKILATVVSVIKAYSERFPERFIFFRGSTTERTRLYRMAIGLNLEELCAEFNIYSYVNEEIRPFSRDIEVTAFLIKRKNV
jgi:hypothetical protein